MTTYIHYKQHKTSIKLVGDRPTDRPTDRQTDRQTNIATYRAAIAAKNLSFNTSNTIYTLPTTYIHYQQHNTSMRLVTDRPTDRPTERQTDRHAQNG